MADGAADHASDANAAFAEKNSLNFPILSDFNKEVSKAYDVLFEDLLLEKAIFPEAPARRRPRDGGPYRTRRCHPVTGCGTGGADPGIGRPTGAAAGAAAGSHGVNGRETASVPAARTARR